MYRVGCSHAWMYTITCCIATVFPQQWAAPDAHGRAVSQIRPERCLAQELFFLSTCRLTDGDDTMQVSQVSDTGPEFVVLFHTSMDRQWMYSYIHLLDSSPWLGRSRIVQCMFRSLWRGSGVPELRDWRLQTNICTLQTDPMMWLGFSAGRVHATPGGTCRNKWLSVHQVIKPTPLAAEALRPGFLATGGSHPTS